MSFPQNYPNSPPSVRFTSEMWHPNVYPDGWVCISILHPPSEDPNGYELASERWTPVHTLVGTDHSTFNSTQIVHVSFSHHDLSLGHCVCGQRVLF
ncbi:ubiquitin carrier protein 7 [Zea mays]|uniref:Ubiquitin carrier protein 7 n=1 Tax=Zea mays TaxID=4577 RepID=A0A1D6K790_MAIZE|nr:ubiquitin carrier protein 7 [Zea mays]ONL99447.1 ubiquitin carrier protein 7 [Zea mays]